MNDDVQGAGARPELVHLPSIFSISVLIVVIVGIEGLRASGVVVPAPFAFIYAALAFTASFSGFRAGMVAAALGSAYAFRAWQVGFGPPTLTGGLLQVALASLIAFAVGGVLGYEHDVRKRLVRQLRSRERRLLRSRERLSGNVAAATARLAKTEAELSDTRYRMEQAIANAPVGILIVDADRRLRFVNDRAIAQFGLDPGSADDSTSWDDLFRSVQVFDAEGNRIEPSQGPVAQVLREGVSFEDYECCIVGADGTTRWFSGYIGANRNLHGEIIGAVTMLVDQTRQKHASSALARLARLLFRVQEQERGMLARELHEEIGQSLTAIKFALHTEAGDDPQHAASMAQIDDLTTTIRQLTLELRPQALDDFGLAAALASALERRETTHGVECILETTGKPVALSDEAATIAYRIVQEAVDNAIEHANATKITVRLAFEAQDLLLEINDNGSGFDPEAADVRAAADGQIGLLLMRERARQYGGSLELESAAGSGTAVRARLPLKAGALDAENETRPDR